MKIFPSVQDSTRPRSWYISCLCHC